MSKEQKLQKEPLVIDSLELLIRFLIICKNKAQNSEFKTQILSCADFVTAAHYYLQFPNVDDFLNGYMTSDVDYFQIQLIRKTWMEISKLNQTELSDLVINRINFVANLDEQ